MLNPVTIPVPNEVEAFAMGPFAQVPGVLLCTLDSRCQLVRTNSIWNEVLGYSPEQLSAFTLLELVHPSDLAKTLGGELELDSETPASGFTVRCRHRDGTYRWIRWNTSRDEDRTHTHAVGMDVTVECGRGGLSGDLTSNRPRQAADQILFEANPNPMWVYDRETLRFLEVNDAAIEHYGYTRADFLSMTLLDIRPAGDAEAVWESVSRHPAKDATSTWTHILKCGEPIQVEVQVRNIDYRGYRARIASIKDVTDQQKAKALLQHNNEVLELRVAERTQQLVAANTELEAFCFSVSHDLRAPLRAIDGFSHSVLKRHGDLLSDEAKSDLERVRKASQRMSELIDALLGLARLTRQELRLQEVDLSAMARLVNEEIRSENPDRVLQCRIQPGMTVNADPRHMCLLLRNLFANAWKFTVNQPKGEIVFESMQTGAETIYSIRDNGAGFDMAYADKLFQPFQRLHHTSEFAGNGIGLATVNRIVSRHGGRTFAHGLINNGATIYFTLGLPNSD